MPRTTRRNRGARRHDYGDQAWTLNEGRQRLSVSLDQIFRELDTKPVFRLIPHTTDIAHEVAALGDWLRDPGDRVIVATARIYRLRLLTADERIIESNLVPVIE